MRHTPGPWNTLAGDWDWVLDGYCRYTIKPLRELNAADANLIAAAPDLYEALKFARAYIGEQPHITERLDAALAKAVVP